MAEPQDSNKLSFFGHLEELRWRLVRVAVVILIFAGALFIYRQEAMDIVFLSMKYPDFPTYRWFCQLGDLTGIEDLCISGTLQLSVTNTTMMGQFSASMYYSIVGGIIIAFPYLFHQFWKFVKPALKQNELTASKGIIFYTSLLFFLGIGFGYFILSPLCVQFAATFALSEDIVNLPTIASYMSMIISTTFYTGLLFELPVVVYLLTKIGFIGPDFLRKYRRHAIVIVLIIAAIITPPDILSQMIVSIPIMILYEISIFISARTERRKLKKAKA